MSQIEQDGIETVAFAAAMAHGAVDPVLVLSTDGTVLVANDAACVTFGEHIVGSPFGIPTSPGGASEIELITPRGPRIAELRTGTAEALGERVLVVSLRDVTERKRVEQALRDFVSTASHEFRTPLFAISGFGETLETQWGELEDEEKLRYVGIMRRQAERLTRLTDDLLTVARLDGDGLRGSPSVVFPAVVAERVSALLDDLEIEVDIDVDLQVVIDPDHLEDVLINLLTNAKKYGEPPYQLCAEERDDRVEIRVVDHGTGVPSDFRERMYERFARERRSARDHPGTGLGLAIARGLLQQNDGDLRYESTSGGGATFVIDLPKP